MRAVLDTNVVMSGIFFGGTPGAILSAWRSGRFALCVSPLVLEEYRRVALELAARFSGIDISGVLDLVTIHAEIVDDQDAPPSAVCRDPDDEKFLLCAALTRSVLVTGDKDLLAVNGAWGVRVLTPRAFASQLRL